MQSVKLLELSNAIYWDFGVEERPQSLWMNESRPLTALNCEFLRSNEIWLFVAELVWAPLDLRHSLIISVQYYKWYLHQHAASVDISHQRWSEVGVNSIDIKAAVINIFTSTTDHMIMRNVKGITHCDKSTDLFISTEPFSLFSVLFYGYCFVSLSLPSSTSLAKSSKNTQYPSCPATNFRQS